MTIWPKKAPARGCCRDVPLRLTGTGQRGRSGDGGKCIGDIMAAGDDKRDVMGIAHCMQRETAAQRQVHDIGRAEISLR